MKQVIALRGVRVHNLKNIDLDIPLDKMIIVTGVSGSGKSSLAFDTLYAEGQRRYIESLSAYARQFLERMEKPEAERIEGIPPAIAIQQKAVTKNPRSTVATVTEIYDFLRVLFARIGIVHCHKCGQPVLRDTIDAIVEKLHILPLQTKIWISFPWPRNKGLSDLQKDGYHRIIYQDEIFPLDLDKGKKNQTLDVLVDRMTLDEEERDRLVDSLEIGLKKGGDRVKVQTEEGETFLFSAKLECKKCQIQYEDPFPNLFSFNSPQGACPKCHGFGDLAVLDEDKVIPDKNKSLEEGAVEPWTKPVSRRRMRRLIAEAQEHNIPTNVPFKDLRKEWQTLIIEGGSGFHGVQDFFDRLQRKKYKVQVRVFISRYRKYVPCPDCHQMRLNPQALSVKILGLHIGEVVHKTVRYASDFFQDLPLSSFQKQVAEKLIAEIQNRLKFLLEVGLDYITLDRMTFTLSGGEAQRINLAAALSTSLVGTLFVLDEPSIGLHARDNQRLIDILKSLKEIGNTVLVVEHDPEIIKSAEYLIDLGPLAGEAGGEIVYAGPLKDFLAYSGSLTADYLRGEKEIKIPEKRRKPGSFLTIHNAHKHNLCHLDIQIPLNVFTCVTGVSGSGKSTLLHDVLYLGWQGKSFDGFQEIAGREGIDKILMVDQSPLSTSPRSIPATYTKAMDDIREVYSQTREAQAMGYKPGIFSFNTSGGRCEECKGAGQQIVEMQFLSDIVLTCEACKGRRFQDEILDIKYKGKNISDVLKMSISEACIFFAERPKIRKKLAPLIEVGLGYLRLGQPTTTLSGGELQRIKLAHNLVHQRTKRILYLFDEPTIGLHPNDISVLLDTFQKLVNYGHTVVVIEHNMDVIKCADHIIDLGPEGGEEGGRVVAKGTPEQIIRSKKSHTALFLRNHLV
ncbi:MAG: excinuclease ABC subunit UvrA [Candidatus Aminicenantaceae bacterium]